MKQSFKDSHGYRIWYPFASAAVLLGIAAWICAILASPLLWLVWWFR